jgi:protein gp37
MRFDAVQAYPDRLVLAARWSDLRGKPHGLGKQHLDGMARHIFLCDMGDIFSPSLHDDDIPGLPPGRTWRDHCHEMMVSIPQTPEGARHIWMVLTKRPSKLKDFLENVPHHRLPRNVYVGVSVTSRVTEQRVGVLARLPKDASVCRFVSIEPMVEPIDPTILDPDAIDWVIVGGETGDRARPMRAEWVEPIRDHCRGRIPFFFKSWGRFAPLGVPHSVFQNKRYLQMPAASIATKPAEQLTL